MIKEILKVVDTRNLSVSIKTINSRFGIKDSWENMKPNAVKMKYYTLISAQKF